LTAVDIKSISQGVRCEHLCPSCKVRFVDDRYERCVGCHMKWKKVYESCLNHGWSEDLARCRADDSYHPMCRA